LLHEIEETLKQVRLKDADENGGLDGERKNYENGESPCDLPPSTSVHQCISAANPPIIIHCSGMMSLNMSFENLYKKFNL
jgi:tyrosine-protein phosphatase non-receptor type 4